MAGSVRVDVKGVPAIARALQKVASDEVVHAAMRESGEMLVAEAGSLAPSDSGALISSIRATENKSLLAITVGNDSDLRYGFNFHAVELGRSKGYLTASVPAGKSKWGTARQSYSRVFPVVDNPFMITAVKNKGEQVLADLRAAVDEAANSG